MDPIRTAVKYSLIPLRAAVQLGEMFVESGASQSHSMEQPERPPQPARRQPQTRAASQRRSTAGPQASRAPKDLDDVGLARKVESVIFRDESVPKGKIDVNAADGIVWLRGEAKTPEMIKGLEAMAKEIPEVKRVENLLHLPHTPAPSRTDTPPAQRATRRAKPAPAKRKVTKEPVTSERHAASAEPAPKDLAQQHEGRQPAPLGSHATPGSTNGSGDDS